MDGIIYITINFTRNSVKEVGVLSAASWAWSTHAMVGSGYWLGVTAAWQADPSGRLGATGRYASTGAL